MARSQLHNWEIKPHRHEVLTQVLHIERGRASVQLDGQLIELHGPGLVTIPALVPHGFRFSPDTNGTVITVNESHLNSLLDHEPGLLATVSRTRAQQLQRRDPQAAVLQAAARAVRDEFLGTAEWRMLALDGALLGLAVAVARAAAAQPTQTESTGPRAQAHVERYKALIEKEFRSQPAVLAIAQRMGITSTQLNRVCQQVLGHSASALLQKRIVLEAKRELTYTTLSIKQVAHELGFADAAYFTRFFQREAQMTPTAWRTQASRKA